MAEEVEHSYTSGVILLSLMVTKKLQIRLSHFYLAVHLITVIIHDLSITDCFLTLWPTPCFVLLTLIQTRRLGTKEKEHE